jgi:hypothetical protein
VTPSSGKQGDEERERVQQEGNGSGRSVDEESGVTMRGKRGNGVRKREKARGERRKRCRKSGRRLTRSMGCSWRRKKSGTVCVRTKTKRVIWRCLKRESGATRRRMVCGCVGAGGKARAGLR